MLEYFLAHKPVQSVFTKFTFAVTCLIPSLGCLNTEFFTAFWITNILKEILEYWGILGRNIQRKTEISALDIAVKMTREFYSVLGDFKRRAYKKSPTRKQYRYLEAAVGW